MADFLKALQQVIENEGGYVLHNHPGDIGGDTFAGISRNYHPDWSGWELVDTQPENPELHSHVQSFYRSEFWERIRGDFIHNDKVAQTIFDFSVNTGVTTAARMAQEVVSAEADGIIGPKTLRKLNGFSPERFINEYALKKVARYASIVNQNPSQKAFLLGWINRALKSIS